MDLCYDENKFKKCFYLPGCCRRFVVKNRFHEHKKKHRKNRSFRTTYTHTRIAVYYAQTDDTRRRTDADFSDEAVATDWPKFGMMLAPAYFSRVIRGATSMYIWSRWANPMVCNYYTRAAPGGLGVVPPAYISKKIVNFYKQKLQK